MQQSMTTGVRAAGPTCALRVVFLPRRGQEL